MTQDTSAPNTGSVMVLACDDTRRNDLGYTRTLPRTGALTVVSVNKPVVMLEDGNGDRHRLNLKTQALT